MDPGAAVSCHYCGWRRYPRPRWPARIDLWRARGEWDKHMIDMHADILRAYGQDR